jgi:predicted enzyme related to lactoylglutathione lyase
MSREVELLSEHPIDVVLLAIDMDASKDFYANKVGLPIVEESPDAVTFKCGGASRLVVSKSSVGTSDEQTQASFRVADVKAEAAYLRSKGVGIEEYDLPGLKTVDGIADIGFALIAWFIDPGKNCVGMLQLK